MMLQGIKFWQYLYSPQPGYSGFTAAASWAKKNVAPAWAILENQPWSYTGPVPSGYTAIAKWARIGHEEALRRGIAEANLNDFLRGFKTLQYSRNKNWPAIYYEGIKHPLRILHRHRPPIDPLCFVYPADVDRFFDDWLTPPLGVRDHGFAICVGKKPVMVVAQPYPTELRPEKLHNFLHDNELELIDLGPKKSFYYPGHTHLVLVVRKEAGL